MNTAQLPKKANIYKAMFYFFFNKEKFITLGAINKMAFELEKDEYKRKLEAGKYSLNSDDHKHSLEEYCDDLRKSILASVLIMLGVFFYSNCDWILLREISDYLSIRMERHR
ncbi:TPA: hypothetical protein ACG7N0_003933 [Escherichia coli]|uniref:hypothetical protein n=1 Tax=Escherichia coli TaxID=562 RepID=UPI0020326823|nr:hypothetical protein [Escherichia coli]MCV0455021.1 hypothetical protein [Escherichia coli]